MSSSYYNGALRYHGLLGPDGSPDFIGSQADGTNRYYFLKDHPSVDGQVLSNVRTTVDFSNTALGYDPDFHRGFTFGIVEMRVAWHTPNGMSAVSMSCLLSIITKGVTGNEKAANIVSLIERFRSAGTIPKSIKNDQILEAVYNLQNLFDGATNVDSDIKTTEQKEKENEDDEKN